jgi:SAM-dependent methyltransferase
MVLIQQAACIESTPISNELLMESGKNIPFVAPVTASKINEHQQVVLLAQEKRLLFGDLNEEMDKWSGASDFCSAIDNIVEIENEKDLFEGKKVLEVGFCTGLATIYALEHGAKEATLVYPSEESYETYIKPTMGQNNVVTEQNINYIIGDVDNLRDKIGENEKFDIILAPELVLTKEEYFERIHDLLDRSLSNDGMIIFSGRTHYNSCNGNMPSMLDLIKSKNRFDSIDRTPSSLHFDTAPRKIVQLFRKML